jgi:hypothetical protein
VVFGNYIEVQKPEKILKILKFDILRVPPIKIPPKKGKNLEKTVEQTLMPFLVTILGSKNTKI